MFFGRKLFVLCRMLKRQTKTPFYAHISVFLSLLAPQRSRHIDVKDLRTYFLEVLKILIGLGEERLWRKF